MVTTVSRMASASPLGFQAGDENLYRFVGNSPTNATDPSGQSPIISCTLTPQQQTQIDRLQALLNAAPPVQTPAPSKQSYLDALGLKPKIQIPDGSGKLADKPRDRTQAGTVPLTPEQQRQQEEDQNTIYFVAGILGPWAIARVIGGFLGMGAVSNAARHGINVERLELTDKVAGHAAQRAYVNSRSLAKEIIEAAPPRADPGGVAGALRWDVPGTLWRPGMREPSRGVYELVIDPGTNRILHFLFRSGG